MTRRLNDGAEYRVVKCFYDPDELAAKLAPLGWDADLRATERYFLYGSAHRRAEA